MGKISYTIRSNKIARRLSLIIFWLIGTYIGTANLDNRDDEIILGVILAVLPFFLEGLIMLDQVIDYITDNNELINNIQEKIGEISNNIKAEDIRILEDPGNTNEFSGFTGEYIGFNPPMHFESANKDKGLDIHKRRYTSDKFTTARYYYPMFTQQNKDLPHVKQWAYNSYQLFSELKKQLGSGIYSKLEFYIPDEDQEALSEEFKITFFKGNKHKGEILIYFHHNEIYMAINRPDYMFVTGNSNIIKRFDSLIVNTNERLKKIDYEQFLQFLKTYINKKEAPKEEASIGEN